MNVDELKKKLILGNTISSEMILGLGRISFCLPLEAVMLMALRMKHQALMP